MLSSIINSQWLNYEFVNSTMKAIGPTCKEYCSDALYKTLGERFWPEVFTPIVTTLTSSEQMLEYLNQSLQYAAEVNPNVYYALAGTTFLVGSLGTAYHYKNRNGKVVVEPQPIPVKTEEAIEEKVEVVTPTSTPSLTAGQEEANNVVKTDALSEVEDAAARLEEELRHERAEKDRLAQERSQQRRLELQRQEEAARVKEELEAKQEQERREAQVQAARIKSEEERAAKEQAQKEAQASQARAKLQAKEEQFQANLKQEQDARERQEKAEREERLLAAQKALAEEKRKAEVDEGGLDKLAAQAVFGQKLEADAREVARQKDLLMMKSMMPQPLNLVALTQVQGAAEQPTQKMPVNDIVVAYIAHLKKSEVEAQRKQGQTFGAKRSQPHLKASVEVEVLNALGLDPKGFAPTSSDGIAHFNQQMDLIGKDNLKMKMPVMRKI